MFNVSKRQKINTTDLFWQSVKHAKLYSDLFEAFKQTFKTKKLKREPLTADGKIISASAVSHCLGGEKNRKTAVGSQSLFGACSSGRAILVGHNAP